MTGKEQKWYVDALEVLSPLRYHGHQILERPTDVGDDVVAVYMSKKQYDDMQAALNKVEDFFVPVDRRK